MEEVMKNIIKIFLVVCIVMFALPNDIYAIAFDTIFTLKDSNHDENLMVSRSSEDTMDVGDRTIYNSFAFNDTNYLLRDNQHFRTPRGSELFERTTVVETEKIITAPKNSLGTEIVVGLAVLGLVVGWLVYVFATWDDDKGSHNFCTINCTYEKSR
jgi:hypothetical protein